ncbi:MAG: acetyl-CoA carboxylase, carboxyltransferase subunit beta [Bacteroidetes bacterium]|nr:acetyl-CoA carboxylase, carboxyltransferase subunit beta [Bacteroidota bacterium]MCL5737293.1 acetyl-CoA carboxylase, carboxyltransferase subunit beta [Bacteroidota bacterium]
MSWFKRSKQNISSVEKKDLPEGSWVKCEKCGEMLHKSQLEDNLWTCNKCSSHFRIGSKEYIQILIDKKTFKETDKNLKSNDPLKFVDTKSYKVRLTEVQKKTGLVDAIRTGTGEINGHKVVLGCMDFQFIGGSMGSVVGEKVARSIDRAVRYKRPLILISQSGGARMMEAALSLMQLAKTSARLTRLHKAGVPYISILSDPTTGGVTASFAMLGDFNVAEPGALIGFAGPRVIKQAVGKDLPEGFQRSEFLLDKGFVDLIVHRKELKAKITQLLELLEN